MRCAFTAVALALIAFRGDARATKALSYAELYSQSDLVAILTVESITLVQGTSADNPLPSFYRDYIAHGRVRHVMKGDATTENVDIPFFQHPKGMPDFNGALPAPFTENRMVDYLAYLRRDDRGKWVATGGTYDAGWSIRAFRFPAESSRHLKLPVAITGAGDSN